MRALQARGLDIWLNDAELAGKAYVSLNVGAGFASEWMGFLGEKVHVGSASSKLYAEAMKKLLQEAGLNSVDVVVTMHCTSLIWETSAEDAASTVQLALDCLFAGVPDALFFSRVKQDSMKRFKESYRDLAFRGYMRMLEFAHQNTLYSYEHLVRNLEKADFEQLGFYKEAVIHPGNMFLFVHGKVDAAQLEALDVPECEEGHAVQLFDANEVRFADDEYFRAASKGDYECGCIRFERQARVEDLTKEHAILSILSELQFGGRVELGVNIADASMVYMRKPLKKYKHEVMTFTQEFFEAARSSLLEKLSTQITLHPLNFVEWTGQFYIQHIHLYEWMQHLEKMTFDAFSGWIEARNYQVREGYVTYYKEAAVIGK